VPTVLVVDDSAADRRLVTGLLEEYPDCTTIEASDGKEALALLEQQQADIVVTDLMMPGINGLELLTALKTDYPHIPVILMTAAGSEEIAAEALRHGAASYVPKRNLADDLVDTLYRVTAAADKDRTHSRLAHYLTRCESEFAIPNDLEVIDMLVDHLQESLRCLPLGDETERLRVGVAIKAALENAYYHGNLEVGATAGDAGREAYDRLAMQRVLELPYRERRIHLRVRLSRTEAVFTIRDEGPGFDHSALPDPIDLCDPDRAVGRGVILMRSIMDEVVYNAAGNQVTLVKRRPIASAININDEDS
jgi:CheY-like chemotaxis protein